MSLDGSKRTCVNNSGVGDSNNPESKIKFLDFIDPSIRDDMGIFWPSSYIKQDAIILYQRCDGVQYMCQDDEKLGMWVALILMQLLTLLTAN